VDIVQIVISLLAGIAAGFVGAASGGGGLLSIPALIFLGLPVNVAVATNGLARFGLITAALSRYHAAKKIHWRIALGLVPLGGLGGFIGSKVLVNINNETLSIIVGVLLLLMIPVIFLNPDKGLKSLRSGRIKTTLGYFVYLLVMVYGGFFGGGAGIFAVYTLVFFFGMTYIESNATDFVPWLFMSIAALAVFLAHGLVKFELGIPLTLGMYCGGILGAKTALEKGNAWVRALFIVVVAASSVKLLFFR
jgi:uncharacterized protein